VPTFRSIVLCTAGALFLGAPSVAAEVPRDQSKRTDAIERLLNSRAAGAPSTYVRALEEVSVEAQAGRVLQGFVLALASQEPNPPPAARLKPAVRDAYLAAGRGPIRMLAEERGNALAWYLLSVDSGDTNLLRRAADLGNVQALNAWGNLLVNVAANDAPSQDRAKALMVTAFAQFKRAAATGDANGLYNLGMCYWRGLGTPRDDSSAFECFRASATKGHPEAINNIGGFFREGIIVPKDAGMSARWFAKSATYDNPFGHYNYALALRRGEGVARDPAAAAKHLRKAADGGCVEAINTLGIALSKGDGLPKDATGAFFCFQRAARAGYPPAMLNLADCYANGSGTAADDRRATEWKVRAKAAAGDRAAREWLERNVPEDPRGLRR